MDKYGVLFDCDGVLLNTEQIAFNVLKAELGIKYDFGYTREEFLEIVSGYEQHQGIERVRHDFREQKGYDLPDDFEEKLWAKIRRQNKKYLEALPGVEALFKCLHDHGIPFAICTNGNREHVEENLKQADLFKYVEGNIIAVEDVSEPKPEPEIYLKGAKHIGVSPENCIYVEDSQTGTKAGRRAGMYGIGYIGENHRHDLIEKFLLLAAGSKKIAYSMDEVSAIISERTGIDLSAPANDGTSPAADKTAKAPEFVAK